jgi:hypothetical protein
MSMASASRWAKAVASGGTRENAPPRLRSVSTAPPPAEQFLDGGDELVAEIRDQGVAGLDAHSGWMMDVLQYVGVGDGPDVIAGHCGELAERV